MASDLGNFPESLGADRVVLLEPRACIRDRGLDLEPVAHDPRILKQLLRVQARHARRVEPGERLPVPLALVQDRRPRQTGLRALEDQQLEQVTRIAGRDSHSWSW